MTKLITWLATLLCAIGAINWGLTAFLKFNVPFVLSASVGVPGIESFLYGVITLSGLWVLMTLFIPCCKK
jgi:uncharacterized membrane protein YuzA (DUF378 family)